MGEGKDYILDIAGLGEKERADKPANARPWIGIRFECCSIYSRVYRNRAGTAYEGRCPKCLKFVRAKIGAGGTAARFFTAD